METAKGKTREEIINRLADRIDSYEKYTHPHSRLIAELATKLAHRFGLATPDVDAIAEAAMLHDIGLYAMAPAYHAVPRPLSFDARLDLWRHPVIGEQQMAKRDAMRHAQLLVRWHHEWWNGSGYPDMLAFEDIPIGARILRAVELYAALICDRPYRAALDQQQAREALTSSAGVECDPYVTKALVALLDELRAGIDEPASETSLNAPAREVESNVRPVEAISVESPAVESAPPVQPAVRSTSDLWIDRGISSEGNVNPETTPSSQTGGSGEPADASQLLDIQTNRQASLDVTDSHRSPAALRSAPLAVRPAVKTGAADVLLSRARSIRLAESDSNSWRGWKGSRYNKKSLLGFEASVLRQIEFRSIAIPFWNPARLDWYLKAWGKLIIANHPSVWAATIARASVEASQPLSEDVVAQILADVYVPGVKLANSDLRQWFGETDAWWMDNLRRNIDRLDDPVIRAQALVLGLQTGDYALSFDEETRELRRPLTTVFWRLAGRAFPGPAGHAQNRSFNQPVEEFLRHARADLLYLGLPSAHTEHGGAEARSQWREVWAGGSGGSSFDKAFRIATSRESKQSYLASIDRLLRPAAQFRTWALEYQEPGLAAAQDIIELIKEYRPVRATYSKDVTEVAGGLRSYIIVGEKPTR